MIHGFFFVPLLVGHARAESVHLSCWLMAKPLRVTEALARAPPTIWQGAAFVRKEREP